MTFEITRRSFLAGTALGLAGCGTAPAILGDAGARRADAASDAFSLPTSDASAIDASAIDASGEHDAASASDAGPISRWETTTPYEDSPPYDDGRYVVRNNFWNAGAPGAGSQSMWAESNRVWGCESTHSNGDGQVKTYSCCVRGWLKVAGFLSAGHRLGIRVDALRRAEARWAFTCSEDPGRVRVNCLWDTYFHDVAAPAGGDLPSTALMINQYCVDRDGFYQGLAAAGTDVTLGGRTWRMYLHDEPIASRRTIQLFPGPTLGAAIGVRDLRFDYRGVVTDLSAMGLVARSEYLTGLQVGFEIIEGGSFRTDDFWLAVQDEVAP